MADQTAKIISNVCLLCVCAGALCMGLILPVLLLGHWTAGIGLVAATAILISIGFGGKVLQIFWE